MLYGFKAIIKKSKPLEGLGEQTINRMMEIFKAMRLPLDDESDDEEYSDDHSTQEEDKSNQKRRRNKRKKNKNKKKKNENPENLLCSEDLAEYLSPEEITRRLIESMRPGDIRY